MGWIAPWFVAVLVGFLIWFWWPHYPFSPLSDLPAPACHTGPHMATPPYALVEEHAADPSEPPLRPVPATGHGAEILDV